MAITNAIIVGGQFGVYGHSAAISLCPEINIIGAYGSSEKSTLDLHHKLNLPLRFATYEKAIQSSDVNLVFLAVPPMNQFDLAIQAFEHDKNVFLEKPLSVNLEAAEKLTKIAQKYNSRTCINFELIELPSIVFLKNLLSQVSKNEILHFNLDWRLPSHAFLTQKKSWKTEPTRGGGFLKHYFSHIFYLIGWLFDEDYVSETSVSDRQNLGGTLLQSKIKFESGITGQFGGVCTSFANTGLCIEIYTKSATYRLENTAQNLIYGYTITTSTAKGHAVVYKDNETMLPKNLDPRAFPVSKLIQKFSKKQKVPDIFDGLKVQKHLEIAHYE